MISPPMVDSPSSTQAWRNSCGVKNSCSLCLNFETRERKSEKISGFSRRIEGYLKWGSWIGFINQWRSLRSHELWFFWVLVSLFWGLIFRGWFWDSHTGPYLVWNHPRMEFHRQWTSSPSHLFRWFSLERVIDFFFFLILLLFFGFYLEI